MVNFVEVLVLVCAASVAPADCTYRNAVQIGPGPWPYDSSVTGCLRNGLLAANDSMGVEPGYYLKNVRKRYIVRRFYTLGGSEPAHPPQHTTATKNKKSESDGALRIVADGFISHKCTKDQPIRFSLECDTGKQVSGLTDPSGRRTSAWWIPCLDAP
jgi:hypothetical protein